jgi:hypothetical protein
MSTVARIRAWIVGVLRARARIQEAMRRTAAAFSLCVIGDTLPQLESYMLHDDRP